MGGKLFLTVFYCPNQGVLVRIVRRGFCRAICSFLDKPACLQFTARVVKTSQTVEGQRDDAVAYRLFFAARMRDIQHSYLSFLEK